MTKKSIKNIVKAVIMSTTTRNRLDSFDVELLAVRIADAIEVEGLN